MRTIATAKVQRNYNCYNVYFNKCLHHIGKKDIFTLETLRLFPYVKVKDLALLRQQGFRCLLLFFQKE